MSRRKLKACPPVFERVSSSRLPSRFWRGPRKPNSKDPHTMTKKSRKRLPKAVRKAAATEFQPCKIGEKGLAGLPTNEAFGELMMHVRVAAVLLIQEKSELVDLTRKYAQSDDATEAHVDEMKSMERCENILREFADMCANARARMYIAGCVAEMELV